MISSRFEGRTIRVIKFSGYSAFRLETQFKKRYVLQYYSRIRLIRHRNGPEKTCRNTRIVVLAGVNINKHSKGLKIQCRFRRIVALGGLSL